MSTTIHEVTCENSTAEENANILLDTRPGNAVLGALTGFVGVTIASAAVEYVAERPEMPVPPVGAACWAAFTFGVAGFVFGKRLNEYRPPELSE